MAGKRERLLVRSGVRAIDGVARLFEPPYAPASNVSPVQKREQKDDRTSRERAQRDSVFP